jgi:hypothetical protein
MMKPLYAYDPATGEYQGSFYGIDPTERGYVVTEKEGWWGAVWDGKGYVAPVEVEAAPTVISDTATALADALSGLPPDVLAAIFAAAKAMQ